MLAGASTLRHRELIINLAARHRLPTVYTDRVLVTAGGLTSYGPDRVEQYRRDKEGQSDIRFDLDGRREWQEGKTGARERKERRIGNFKPTREPGNKHGAAWHRKV